MKANWGTSFQVISNLTPNILSIHHLVYVVKDFTFLQSWLTFGSECGIADGKCLGKQRGNCPKKVKFNVR